MNATSYHLLRDRRRGPAFDPFVLLCRAHQLPEPEVEVEGLVPGRKFRVDYLFRDAKVVLEQNGAIWKKGGHSSGTGLLRDYEKSNLLQLAGYRYLQFTPGQLTNGDCLPLLKILLGNA